MDPFGLTTSLPAKKKIEGPQNSLSSRLFRLLTRRKVFFCHSTSTLKRSENECNRIEASKT